MVVDELFDDGVVAWEVCHIVVDHTQISVVVNVDIHRVVNVADEDVSEQAHVLPVVPELGMYALPLVFL